MHALSVLVVMTMVGGPRDLIWTTADPTYAEQQERAIRERRPLLVFMGDAFPEKEPTDIWVCAYKPIKLPMPTIVVYVPSNGLHLEFAGTARNVEGARQIIRYELERIGCSRHVPTPSWEWDPLSLLKVMRRIPQRMPR